MFDEIGEVFTQINDDPTVRVVVLTGNGKHFTAGLDLSSPVGLMSLEAKEVSRRALDIRKNVIALQDSFTAIEKAQQPVIAAIHGVCYGAGIDVISACDIRYASKDVRFSIKEIDVGLVADVGTFPRILHLTGNDSLLRELSYTGRELKADEALRFGLISRIFDSKTTVQEAARKLAKEIAEKSPIALIGIKKILNYSRDHSVSDTLDYVTVWNQAMLQSEDMRESIVAFMGKRKPVYSKL
uniref:Enoyl-CoA hydratase n=2 Tax=Hirondellea gigas TaxID=1518452 RepID=A0A2P2IAB6_9CRUS